MDDIKRWSMKLLLLSGVITIFVLAYILSRISPGTRDVKVLESRLAALNMSNHLGSATPGLGAVQEDNAEEQFFEAMQCSDSDVLVTQGRK
jgi:hypothetical protein